MSSSFPRSIILPVLLTKKMALSIDRNKNQIYLHVVGTDLKIRVLGSGVVLPLKGLNLNSAGKVYFKTLSSGLVVKKKKKKTLQAKLSNIFDSLFLELFL